MKRFRFRFESSVVFSSPVSSHSWLLRALPKQEQFQRTEEDSLRLEAGLPDGRCIDVPVRSAVDAFGGRVQFGCVLQPHVRLTLVSAGTVAQSPYRICGTAHGMYFPPSPLTLPSDEMLTFAREQGLDGTCVSGISQRARAVASAVHARMEYAPGCTGVATTAAQAFALGRGVCQDFAHITLALLRHAGVAARYVCGFLPGEGATHAWVEYFDSGVWLALDPTHDRSVDYGCIKIAHGRDSADCPVNRGVFTGKVQQHTTVSIKVDPL